MSRLTRPRQHRLLRRSDFTACYDAGRRFFSKNFVVFVHKRTSETEDWRMGMAITKKVGTAVVRNRVKRVLRECFRLHQSLLASGFDLVIIPKRHLVPDTLTLATASCELVPLLEEVNRYVASCRIQSPRCGWFDASAGERPEASFLSRGEA